MRIKAALALAALPVLFALAPAKAATYTFQGNNLGGNTKTGDHSNITATFNNNTNLLTWSSTFTDNGKGPLAEGAWLVLSDGPNPKKHVDEYAIFYLDGLTEQVSIYNYNGENKADSYKKENYLGGTALQVTNNGSDRTFEFSVDVSDINNDVNGLFGDDWEGASFADNIGIWFHGASDLTTKYKNDGSLKRFHAGTSGWYDVSDKGATSVPEPGSVAALGLFAAAAAGKLRKRLS
ncbi:MAG: hypothetical protein AAGL17_20815 [Cyanobacteria bacterium J06576_12]